MNRTSRRVSTKVMLTLVTVIGLAGLLLSSRAILPGIAGNSTPAAKPQGPFNNSDNFIFTNASLKGTYAGVLDCTLVIGPTPAPCAVSYLYTADGNGNINNTNATVNINGQTTLNVEFPGTYTVNTSGRISMVVTPINGPLTGVPLSVSSVVTETQGGQITELRGVDTSPGIVSTRVEKRIRK
jgi:hypothetical protein